MLEKVREIANTCYRAGKDLGTALEITLDKVAHDEKAGMYFPEINLIVLTTYAKNDDDSLFV